MGRRAFLLFPLHATVDTKKNEPRGLKLRSRTRTAERRKKKMRTRRFASVRKRGVTLPGSFHEGLQVSFIPEILMGFSGRVSVVRSSRLGACSTDG